MSKLRKIRKHPFKRANYECLQTQKTQTQTQKSLNQLVVSGQMREPYSVAIYADLNFPTLLTLCDLFGPKVKKTNKRERK